MHRINPETITTRPVNATSPRVLDIATRAEAMARDLAALAGTETERAMIGRIVAGAVRRTFGAGVRS